MNTSNTAQYVTVATPDATSVRYAPDWVIGDPVTGIEYPTVNPSVEQAVRLILSGVPATFAAETLGIPVDEIEKESRKFDISKTDLGVVYAKVAAAFRQGRIKAELAREFHLFTEKVKDALYLHQLLVPPGKAADEMWCVKIAKRYVNRVPLTDLVKDESCSEEEIRAGVLWAGILAPAVPAVPISIQRACLALHPSSSIKAAGVVGLSDTQVKTIWRRDGKKPLGRSAWTKYHYNKDTFSTLDPETEYWIGYWFADGTSPGRQKMTITTARCNRYHLIRCNDFMGGDNLPRSDIVHLKKYNRDYPIARLDICCPQIVENLYQWGFRPNRRYETMAGVVLDERLIWSPHFLRGYFDGNGGISGTRRCYIDISSPLPCVHRAYDAWLNQNAPPKQVDERKWKEVGKCWNLSLSTKPAQMLMNYMYFDAAGMPFFPALRCKLELAMKWRESDFDPILGPEEIPDVIRSHLAGETFASIAARYSCSEALVCVRFHEHCFKKDLEEEGGDTPFAAAAA